MAAELLSFFVIGTAYIIFFTVWTVDGSQLVSAVLTVKTAGEKIDMFFLTAVLAVAAAFLHFMKELHGIIIENLRMVIIKDILLIPGNFFVFSVYGGALSLVGAQDSVIIIIEQRILYHRVAPFTGNMPMVGKSQSLIPFPLQHGGSWHSPLG